jgi:hypothetical protein
MRLLWLADASQSARSWWSCWSTANVKAFGSVPPVGALGLGPVVKTSGEGLRRNRSTNGASWDARVVLGVAIVFMMLAPQV